MNQNLTVITTCTNRKNIISEVGCQLREYAGEDYLDTLSNWIRSLSESHPRVPCRELYQGSHWNASLRCVENAKQAGLNTNYWILSAGWGVLDPEEKIPAYDATFTTDWKVEDRIHTLDWPDNFSNTDRAREWWKGLRKHQKQSPSRLVDVPGITEGLVLFILSQEYYEAIEPELLELLDLNDDLVIMSAGLFTTNRMHPDLKRCVPSVSADFQLYRQCINNTNVSLNADLAAWVTEEFANDLSKGAKSLIARIEEVADLLPDASAMTQKDFIEVALKIGSDLPVPNLGNKDSLEEFWAKRNKALVKMTDEEVLAFIADHYDPDTSSASSMLKQLRHELKASCEQKRFGGLFRQFKDDHGKKNNHQMELF